MIDSHCHLEMAEFEPDLRDVLARMTGAGVSHAVSIGSIAINERIERTLEIAGSHDFIYTTLGVHPKSPYKNMADIPELFEKYYRVGGQKIVAVGEIGLDYFLPGVSGTELENIKEKQKELFRLQLGIAAARRLPAIVHIRDAYGDAMEILKGYAGSVSFSGGVIHCFSSDDPGIAEEFLKMGFFISFSGNITYKKNDGLRAVAKGLPAEKILMETDSPYLAPQQFRGKRNEPSYVRFVAETIAGLKGVEQEKFSGLTVQNTVNLFSLRGVNGFYPSVAYKIRNSVYVNLTNKCTNRCTFCPKYKNGGGDGFDTGGGNFNVRGYNLELRSEPSAEEAVSSVFRYYDFKEVVFCGLGEPTLRLDVLKDAAAAVRKKWAENNAAGGLKIRLDTDGLANAVYGKNAAAELEGLIDSVSISVNAHSREFYEKICDPQISRKGVDAYASVIDFVKESKKYIPEVTVTAVGLPGLDAAYVENLAGKIGVNFKLRKYNDVG